LMHSVVSFTCPLGTFRAWRGGSSHLCELLHRRNWRTERFLGKFARGPTWNGHCSRPPPWSPPSRKPDPTLYRPKLWSRSICAKQVLSKRPRAGRFKTVRPFWAFRHARWRQICGNFVKLWDNFHPFEAGLGIEQKEVSMVHELLSRVGL